MPSQRRSNFHELTPDVFSQFDNEKAHDRKNKLYWNFVSNNSSPRWHYPCIVSCVLFHNVLCFNVSHDFSSHYSRWRNYITKIRSLSNEKSPDLVWIYLIPTICGHLSEPNQLFFLIIFCGMLSVHCPIDLIVFDQCKW